MTVKIIHTEAILRKAKIILIIAKSGQETRRLTKMDEGQLVANFGHVIDNDDWTKISINCRPLNSSEPKKIEPNQNNELERKRKHGELMNKLSSYQKEPQSKERDWKIEMTKKDIEVLETKIQYEKDWLAKNSNFDIKPAGCCNCGRKINHSEVYWYDGGLEDRYALCSSDCKEKFINDSGKSDLRKENQELRQELSEVKNQLAQVLDELKKLKRDINGKGSEKLEKQIIQNEKLIKEGEKVSVAEIQEQVNKSQALMNEFNTTASSTKNDKGNGSLPYVIGGSVIVALVGIIGYFLLKKNKRNK